MSRPREAHHTPPVPLRALVTLGAVAIALLIIGSFLDLPLAQRLYSPDNPFGTVLAAYGEAPSLLALIAAGTLAILARPPVHAFLRATLIVGGVGLITAGTLALVIRPEEYWALPASARTVIAIVLAVLVIRTVTKASDSAPWQVMCILAGALFAVVAAEMVLVQGVKIFWERPRPRMLVATGSEFAPWWSPGYPDRQALLEQGVERSEFKSFPSGHTANASVALMLAGFAMLREDLRRHRTKLFWVGALWVIIIAFSRLTVGAHFLTDTAAAMLIGVVGVALISFLAAGLLNARVLDRLPVHPLPPPVPLRHGRKPS